jgi:hypothetical protein
MKSESAMRLDHHLAMGFDTIHVYDNSPCFELKNWFDNMSWKFLTARMPKSKLFDDFKIFITRLNHRAQYLILTTYPFIYRRPNLLTIYQHLFLGVCALFKIRQEDSHNTAKLKSQ